MGRGVSSLTGHSSVVDLLSVGDGLAAGGGVGLIIQKNMVEGKSKDEIQELSLKSKIFRPRSFIETWRLYDKIKGDIKWAD